MLEKGVFWSKSLGKIGSKKLSRILGTVGFIKLPEED